MNMDCCQKEGKVNSPNQVIEKMDHIESELGEIRGLVAMVGAADLSEDKFFLSQFHVPTVLESIEGRAKTVLDETAALPVAAMGVLVLSEFKKESLLALSKIITLLSAMRLAKRFEEECLNQYEDWLDISVLCQIALPLIVALLDRTGAALSVVRRLQPC